MTRARAWSLFTFDTRTSTSTDINDPVFSDKYYEKTLEEICRDDIILDFSSSDINGILRNYIEEVSLNFSPP